MSIVENIHTILVNQTGLNPNFIQAKFDLMAQNTLFFYFRLASPGTASAFICPTIMIKTSRPALPATFEAALTELEAIVREMETGQLPLEESLASYERGAALLKHCQEALGAAEKKLQMLENGGLHDFDRATGKSESDASDT